MVVHWPKGIKAKGEKRRQYHHLIDIVPTVLDAVGIPEPKIVNGVEQIKLPGVSMRYSFDDANAKDRHITQYTEVHGNRSIYHDGWLAATIHFAFWEAASCARTISPRTSGSCTTCGRTSVKPMTWRRRTRRSWRR